MQRLLILSLSSTKILSRQYQVGLRLTRATTRCACRRTSTRWCWATRRAPSHPTSTRLPLSPTWRPAAGRRRRRRICSPPAESPSSLLTLQARGQPAAFINSCQFYLRRLWIRELLILTPVLFCPLRCGHWRVRHDVERRSVGTTSRRRRPRASRSTPMDICQCHCWSSVQRLSLCLHGSRWVSSRLSVRVCANNRGENSSV